MGRLVWGSPYDDLIALADTVTVDSGTPLEGYDIERLNNGDLGYPFKIAETTLDLRFHFASPVLPEWVVLAHSNVNVAWKWQGHTADVWTAPDIDLDGTAPTMNRAGFFTAPHLDLREETAKAHWRLLIESNARPIILGGLGLIATRVTLETGYDRSDTTLSSGGRSVTHQTPFDLTLAYRQATKRDAIDGSVVVTTAELADLQTLFDEAGGRASPFYFLADDTVQDAKWVRLSADRLQRRLFGQGGWRVPLPVVEESLGLAWVEVP